MIQEFVATMATMDLTHFINSPRHSSGLMVDQSFIFGAVMTSFGFERTTTTSFPWADHFLIVLVCSGAFPCCRDMNYLINISHMLDEPN